MHEQQLSSPMQRRVLDFFGYLWVRNNGTDRQTLLADLPYCMQAEVSMATTEPLMRNVQLHKYFFLVSTATFENPPLLLYLKLLPIVCRSQSLQLLMRHSFVT